MGICWHCYWGWPKAVKDIYDEAVAMLDGDMAPLLYGPAHVVWEDENWDFVQECLETFDEQQNDFSQDDLAVVRWSLEELAKVPLEERDLCPEDYDDEHPKDFPPPEGSVMVR